MSCGVEQSTVLPSVAFLGAVAWGLGSYRISQSTLGAKRERDWRKRRAGETLGVETSWIEPKAIGHTTDRSSDVSEKVKAAAESSHLAMRAIHEDRVLLLDRDGYLAARSYLRISGGCLICASVAATAQPSAGDLLFATLRQLLLLLLCIDFAFTVPGQVAFLLRSARGQSLQKLPLLASRHHEDLMPFPSGPASLLRSLRSSKPLPFERLRLGLLQLAALLMLIWFEVFRHPKLRESACEGEVALLLSERSSAFTMTFAWLCAAIARLSAWQCEACVWLAPRAEELLAEYLETDGGVVLQGSACALAEGLCGEDGPSWLNELQQLSVIVMDGSCQLSVPAKGLPTLSEIMNLQHEAQLELRRLSQLLEASKEPREATASTERPSTEREHSGARPLARRRSHEVAALAAATKREELLKTKFEFPRGDGKPSDSGDSSSPRNAADPQRVMVDLGVGVADGPRGHGHGGLAQLLEEALAPAMSLGSMEGW
eukprot:symbB.v1.2.028549.t1/scaffold3037.1/size102045/2